MIRVVVAMPFAQVPPTLRPAGSREAPCHTCGTLLLVSPSTDRRMAGLAHVVLCLPCRRAKVRPLSRRAKRGRAASWRATTRARKAKHLCWRCAQPAAAGRVLCELHLAWERARYQRTKGAAA